MDGVAAMSQAASKKDLLSRVDACYRFAQKMGDPLIGYFPEATPSHPEKRPGDPRTVEICEVTNMVVIALKPGRRVPLGCRARIRT